MMGVYSQVCPSLGHLWPTAANEFDHLWIGICRWLADFVELGPSLGSKLRPGLAKRLTTL